MSKISIRNIESQKLHVGQILDKQLQENQKFVLMLKINLK